MIYRWSSDPQIKYEEEMDQRFAAEIVEAVPGTPLSSCIQCGTCSGTCPLSIYMDFTPRRIIAMSRAGMKKEVLNSFTIWLCASCYECTVECPKQIKITDIMYNLKQRAIRDKVYPKRFPIAVLAREFFNEVLQHGRNNEGPLLIKLYLKTNPFAMIKQSILALRLFLTGRLGLIPDGIKAKRGEKGDLQTILNTIEKNRQTAVRTKGAV
ncbi:MAG TPA: 4Fe-4S dicluster domain-containing protein [Armatimonadota bacterium]|jgi:heterodisulfide reductase subunit C